MSIIELITLSISTNLALGFIETKIFLSLGNYLQKRRIYLAILFAELINLGLWLLMLFTIVNFDTTLRTFIAQLGKLLVMAILFTLLSKKQISFNRSFNFSLIVTLSGLIVLWFLENELAIQTNFIIIGIIFFFKYIAGLIYIAFTNHKPRHLLPLFTANSIILPGIFVFELLQWPNIVIAFFCSIIIESYVIYVNNKIFMSYKKAMWISIMANSPVFIITALFILFFFGNQFLITN